MKLSIHEFNRLISNFEANVPILENIYVIFKAAYTENELEKLPYSLEILEFDGDNCTHVWLNDWNEGQKYIDFFRIYSESELLGLIMSMNTILRMKGENNGD